MGEKIMYKLTSKTSTIVTSDYFLAQDLESQGYDLAYYGIVE